MKTLMVFDFDHTVVDDNSDTWVIRCLPSQTLPDVLKNSYKKGHWTEFMGRVMNYIGDQEVSPDSVRSVMETIPFTDGMRDLLTFISENKSTIDCIVVSDANTMFIDWILHAAGLQAAVDQVFTNPAKFNDLGYMEVQCYHSHDCERCPVNLCKKKVLELYLSEQSDQGVEYGQIGPVKMQSYSFPRLTATLLNALILVVFAHLKLIMKCMHWAKQAINQSRCVSRVITNEEDNESEVQKHSALTAHVHGTPPVTFSRRLRTKTGKRIRPCYAAKTQYCHHADWDRYFGISS
ncbi:pyridoxal phosphate phosphatase PHOSPHO2 [Scomber scombrus]|uniref:Pyridoxal phosphate phosphatase PHOSPHO2 n=1 Tax=Scomber scombrus TaxID=13677 RepID=A0AAV1P6F7_SCOSC